MSTVTQDVLSAGQRIVTMNQLIDEAIDTLPLFRRRMMRLRLSRPRHRHEVCCELQVKLHDDHRVQALGLQPMFASDAFSAETPFSIDVDRLRQLLDLILEYLPRILDFLLLLFSVALVAMLGLAVTPSVGFADERREESPHTVTLSPAKPVERGQEGLRTVALNPLSLAEIGSSTRPSIVELQTAVPSDWERDVRQPKPYPWAVNQVVSASESCPEGVCPLNGQSEVMSEPDRRFRVVERSVQRISERPVRPLRQAVRRAGLRLRLR